MNLSINISNDQELRGFIKNLISDQVKAIVREDFKELIQAEVKRKVDSMYMSDFRSQVTDSFHSAMSAIIREKCDVGKWNNDWVKPFINDHVERLIAGCDIKSLIDQAATDKIRSLLNL